MGKMLITKGITYSPLSPKYLLVFSAAISLVACHLTGPDVTGISEKGSGSSVECIVGYVYCVPGHEWIGNPDYCLYCPADDGYCYNYACEQAPIEEHFLLDAPSFVKFGRGISDEGSVEDALNAARAKWNDIGAAVVIEHDLTDQVDPGKIYDEDRLNQIVMVDDYGTSFGGSDDYVAVAWVQRDLTGAAGVEGEEEYVITDCDIEVYAQSMVVRLGHFLA